MLVKFKKLLPTATIPTKAYPTDAGFDLYAAETAVIRPGETVKVNTGIACAPPQGYFFKVFDRSSMGSKGILVNAGVIDNSYRGPIIVCLTNLSNGDDYDTHTINVGDKIAQMVLLPSYEVIATEVEDLDESERGDKGFGSSGK